MYKTEYIFRSYEMPEKRCDVIQNCKCYKYSLYVINCTSNYNVHWFVYMQYIVNQYVPYVKVQTNVKTIRNSVASLAFFSEGSLIPLRMCN